MWIAECVSRLPTKIWWVVSTSIKLLATIAISCDPQIFSFVLRFMESDGTNATESDGAMEASRENNLQGNKRSSPSPLQVHTPSSPTPENSLSLLQQSPVSSIKETRQNSLLRLRLPLVNSTTKSDCVAEPNSPSSVRDVKDKILASSKNILGKVLSPSKEKVTAREKVKYYYK